MNQRKIDEMIPLALDVLASTDENMRKMKAGDYAIKKVYFGYLSAFGPSVVQSGIAKTLAFYGKKSSGGEGDRSLILNFIKQVFQKAYPAYEANDSSTLLELYKAEISKENFTTLHRLAFADKIIEASIACKLVMNTYKAEKEVS